MSELPHIDKGDFLTFASISKALGMPYSIESCEIEPGVWRRHPDLKVSESRSDISRDGYIGLIFYALVSGDRDILARVRSAGWKRRWTMGDRGLFDYVNIWPLIPYLYAAKWKWFPTPPVLIMGKGKTGYRAHLAAMIIMVDILLGKSYNRHTASIEKLIKHNPTNNLFRALGGMTLVIINGEHDYDWGGCEPELFDLLVRFAGQMYGGKEG